MHVSAQNETIFQESNFIPDSDDVNMSIIHYLNATGYGKNKVWNFNDIDAIEASKLSHRRDFQGRIIEFGNNHVSHLILQTDTLFISSNETPLSRIVYNKPLMLMRYPLAYGDSVSAPFCGNGVYCGDHPFREQGISTIIADAKGSIVIDNDTIPNVLRVYSLKSYSICMDIDSAALDTARLKQVIEERYDWYARGYRYPLFTAITSTSYDATKVIGTSQKAYCMLPESQRLQNDPYNQAIRNKDSLSLAERNNADEEIFHYTIDQNGNQFTINYSLDKDADITILVSDVMGVAYKRSHYHSSKGEDYSVNIDCTGLRYGQYVLYMNVNGKIYSDNITIKP